MSTPDTLSGWPRFKGVRMPLQVLVNNLLNGMTPEEFIEDYPSVTLEEIAVVQAWLKTVPPSDYPNTIPEHFRFMVLEEFKHPADSGRIS